jgi:hypothetical protein
MPFDFPDRPGCTVEELRSDLKNVLFPHVKRKTITATIGTNQTAVVHGLPDVPTVILPVVKGNSTVWISQDADSKRVYLTASSSVTVVIEVSCA